MIHDVTFNKKSIDTYGLILEDVDLGSPEPQISRVSIPGRNGSLDYTEAIAGYTAYYDRAMAFTLVRDGTQTAIEAAKESIFTDIHGQEVDIRTDWLEGYFHGRASVEVADYRPNFLRLVVNVTAEPYRYAEEAKTISLASGENTVNNSGALPVVPTFVTTGTTIISIGTSSWTVAAGTHRLSGIVLMPGSTTITVSSACTITFTEGYL